MASLRMVLVHYEGDSAEAAADLLRMALRDWAGDDAEIAGPPAPPPPAVPVPVAPAWDFGAHGPALPTKEPDAAEADQPARAPRKKAAPPPENGSAAEAEGRRIGWRRGPAGHEGVDPQCAAEAAHVEH